MSLVWSCNEWDPLEEVIVGKTYTGKVASIKDFGAFIEIVPGKDGRYRAEGLLLPTVIRALKLPTLILWGGKDFLIPVDNGKRFATDIAGSRLVVWDDLGHVPHEEDPQRTVEALLAFLD